MHKILDIRHKNKLSDNNYKCMNIKIIVIIIDEMKTKCYGTYGLRDK